MDLQNAVLVVVAVVGLTEFFKRLLAAVGFENPNAAVVQFIAFGAALVILFLVGATVWAHEQVIGNQPLDQLGVADKVFAAIVIGLTANFTDRALKSVANIGSNADKSELPR